MRRRVAGMLVVVCGALGMAAAASHSVHAQGSGPAVCVHRTLTHDINVYVCP